MFDPREYQRNRQRVVNRQAKLFVLLSHLLESAGLGEYVQKAEELLSAEEARKAAQKEALKNG